MTIPDSSDDWSDDLKARTREAIEDYGIFAMRDGQLCLKHIGSGFGTIAADDLSRGVLRVVDRRTKQEATYATAEDLVAGGWVVD